MTRTLNTILVLLLFGTWIVLFAVKGASRDATTRIEELHRQTAQTEDSIRTLMTDWEILNEPGYLQDLAQAHLDLDTMRPNQIVTLAALPPVPMHMPQAEESGGTYFASTRGMQQLSVSNGSAHARPRVEEVSDEEMPDWPTPTFRPELTLSGGGR